MIHSLFSIVCLVVFCTACTNFQEKSTAVPHSTDSKVEILNYKLATIESEEDAEEAVNYFVKNVEQNIQVRSDRKTIKTLSSASALKSLSKQYAKKEYAIRHSKKNKNFSTFSLEGGISPQDVVDALLKVEERPFMQVLTADMVRSTSACVRRVMPDIQVYTDDRMTPFEAAVVMYHIYSGDEGNGEAHTFTVDDDRLSMFLALLDKNQGEEEIH